MSSPIRNRISHLPGNAGININLFLDPGGQRPTLELSFTSTGHFSKPRRSARHLFVWKNHMFSQFLRSSYLLLLDISKIPTCSQNVQNKVMTQRHDVCTDPAIHCRYILGMLHFSFGKSIGPSVHQPSVRGVLAKRLNLLRGSLWICPRTWFFW